MAKYKNVSGAVHILHGIGEVKPGEVIEAEDLNNANFERVKPEEKKEKPETTGVKK